MLGMVAAMWGTLALLATVGRYYMLQEVANKEAWDDKVDDDSAAQAGHRVVCYLELAPVPELLPAHVDPTLCSHLALGYAAVSGGMVAPRAWDHLEVWKTAAAELRERNPGLSVLLSVGDRSGGGLSRVVASAEARQRFIVSLIYVVETFDFDGLDFDWEFPAWSGAPSEEKDQFLDLLEVGTGGESGESRLTVAAGDTGGLPCAGQTPGAVGRRGGSSGHRGAGVRRASSGQVTAVWAAVPLLQLEGDKLIYQP
ncbi:Cht11 [Cordylochernes scorpioides]|uniref:Cht11 n=1 Tax=Cordylochernes scorpioides TaxID=51811 RepID=A0ABY6LQY7_9ARAC|nr:Cht11 [Cordylochernes scorpioides]